MSEKSTHTLKHIFYFLKYGRKALSTKRKSNNNSNNKEVVNLEKDVSLFLSDLVGHVHILLKTKKGKSNKWTLEEMHKIW